MLNVANLELQWFEEILSGRKRVEYRHRVRIDPRLEAIPRAKRWRSWSVVLRTASSWPPSKL